MKKSAFAAAVTTLLVLIIAALGCAQRAPAAFSQIAPPPPTGRSLEQALEDTFEANRALIGELIMANQPVTDYQWATLWSFEEARHALDTLETQRRATQLVIDQYTREGTLAPDFQYATLQAVEDARVSILANVGLVD